MLRKWTLRETNQVREFLKASRSTIYDESYTYTLKLAEWTSGRGRYAKPRALPPFTRRVRYTDYNLPTHAAEFFKDNPHCIFCYYLDIDALTQAVAERSTDGTIEGLRGQEFEF